eukprot:12900432-Prorocentrum_lima.AAC.1
MVLVGGERELVLTVGLGALGNGVADTIIGVYLPAWDKLEAERTSMQSPMQAFGPLSLRWCSAL